jgi:acetyltransferase-like isoleucine patch superfamily enzyme
LIHFDCIPDGRCGLAIGNCVDIGHQVKILTLQHDMDDVDYGTEGALVSIRDYAVIAGRSTILPGVTVGEAGMVTAGAVVTKPIELYTIGGGVPARFIRSRP